MGEGTRIEITPSVSSPGQESRPGSKNQISAGMSDGIETQLPTPLPSAQISDSLPSLLPTATHKLPSSALTQIIVPTSPRSPGLYS